MTSKTDRDAREFGEHIKHGGWRLGLLVARSVERGVGHGGDRFNMETKSAAPRTWSGKVSISGFAAAAGIGDARVRRYLEAWERAAAAGHVPPPAELVPGEGVTLPDDETVPWSKFYRPVTGGRLLSRPDDAVTIIERRGTAAVVDAMTDPQRREFYVALGAYINAHTVTADPIRDDDTRARTGRLLLVLAGGLRKVQDAVAAVRSGEVDTIDDDDRQRVRSMVQRMRAALDLLDMAAGDGISDAALEAWLSEESER